MEEESRDDVTVSDVVYLRAARELILCRAVRRRPCKTDRSFSLTFGWSEIAEGCPRSAVSQ